MKNQLRLLVFVFFILINSNYGQDKIKTATKQGQKEAKMNEVATLIKSGKFVFYARFVEPFGARTINVDGENYTIGYSTELIDSYLPFFGRAYHVRYGGDPGLKFKGKPENYVVEKKKKYYLITTSVKGEFDTFRLALSVYFEGSASLSVSSNNRSAIRYSGQIQAAEPSK